MFEKCLTATEVKELFRKLAKFLHPDVGGDAYLMNRLQESRDYFISLIENCEKLQNQQEPKYHKSYEDVLLGDENLEIIQDILRYAQTHPKFTTNFVESVEAFLEENGYITSAQYNALVKCYYAFKMWKNNT